MPLDQVSVQITDNTHVSEARRASVRLAQGLDFESTAEGNLAIVVTELARNVLLHGRTGEIVLQPAKESGTSWVEVLALDHGPGINSVSTALQDGYSSAGTPGTGLGAVRRLAARIEFYTKANEGTVISATVMSGGSPAEAEKMQTTGSVCVPVAGETRCGDAWEHQDQSGRRLIMVADGLGHGSAASDAAQEAIVAFRANLHRSPKEIIEAAHGRLQKTRGAAVAVAEIEFERQLVRYSGIGNIGSVIVSNGTSRRLISHNGIVGHRSETVQEFTFPWQPGAFLIMHSDGVSARWNLEHYQGLQRKSPSMIAGVLYRDFKRTRDDATVVVSREARAA